MKADLDKYDMQDHDGGPADVRDLSTIAMLKEDYPSAKQLVAQVPSSRTSRLKSSRRGFWPKRS